MRFAHYWRGTTRDLILGAAVTVFAAIGLAPWHGASAYTFKSLYSFCTQSNCTDGNQPEAALIVDSSGDLYGTTTGGGTNCQSQEGCGAVFELALNAHTMKWTEKVLYSFCSHGGDKCTDGETPYAALITDSSRNLYGTTGNGGDNFAGTVFELTFNTVMKKWDEKVLFAFSCSSGKCPDGQQPVAGLIKDSSGNLYGTAPIGGGGTGGGTVFELQRNTTGTTWTPKVLHSFSCAPTTCPDGQQPVAGLLRASGNLYGTATEGGDNQSGTVFELTLNATTKVWAAKPLSNFPCSGSVCAAGSVPRGAAIMDGSGNLYGIADEGGTGAECGFGGGCGTVFELTLDATTKKWTEKILYNFCSRNNTERTCIDGAGPSAGLLRDASGNLYGTTRNGGLGSAGTVFELVN